MGKVHSPLSRGKVQELSKIVSFHLQKPKKSQPVIPFKSNEVRVGGSDQLKVKKMEETSNYVIRDGKNRLPLSNVVSDCVKRWFQDTLKEAKAGDVAMQILVGQMYINGYGVRQNSRKGHAWINLASERRASALKVTDKRPGYDATDSNSDDEKEDANKTR